MNEQPAVQLPISNQEEQIPANAGSSSPRLVVEASPTAKAKPLFKILIFFILGLIMGLTVGFLGIKLINQFSESSQIVSPLTNNSL